MRSALSFALFLVIACGLVPSAPAQLNDEVKGQLDRARGLMMRRQYDDAIGEMKRAIKMANGQCVPCYLELVRAYQTENPSRTGSSLARLFTMEFSRGTNGNLRADR